MCAVQAKFGLTVSSIDISPSVKKPLWVAYIKSHGARKDTPLSALFETATGTPLPSHRRALLLDLGVVYAEGDVMMPLVRLFVR